MYFIYIQLKERTEHGYNEEACTKVHYHCSFLDQATLVEQVKRVKEIEAIESDSFIQQTFRSSKEVKKVSFYMVIMIKPLGSH